MNTPSVIIGPVITEKSTDQQAHGRYSFLIRPEANKIQVKQAIQDLYGITVSRVSIQTLPAKHRALGRGRTFRRRPNTKRAIVQTKDRKPLDINKLTTQK